MGQQKYHQAPLGQRSSREMLPGYHWGSISAEMLPGYLRPHSDGSFGVCIWTLRPFLNWRRRVDINEVASVGQQKTLITTKGNWKKTARNVDKAVEE